MKATELEKIHYRLVKKVIVEKRKAWREGVTLGDSFWGIFYFVFYVLTVIVGLAIIVSIFFWLVSFQLIGVLSALFLGLGFLSYGCFRLATESCEKGKPFVVDCREISAVWLVSGFFEDKLERLESELVGSDSRFGKSKRKIRKIKGEAAELIDRIKRELIERPEAQHLGVLLVPNQEIFDRANKLESELEDFERQVKKFLADCLAEVSKIRIPLNDLDLIMATNNLAKRMISAEHEAWSSAATVAGQLCSVEDGLRREMTARFGEGRVWGLSELNVPEPRRYIEIIETSVKGFDFKALEAKAPKLAIDR